MTSLVEELLLVLSPVKGLVAGLNLAARATEATHRDLCAVLLSDVGDVNETTGLTVLRGKLLELHLVHAGTDGQGSDSEWCQREKHREWWVLRKERDERRVVEWSVRN